MRRVMDNIRVIRVVRNNPYIQSFMLGIGRLISMIYKLEGNFWRVEWYYLNGIILKQSSLTVNFISQTILNQFI